MYTTNSRTEQCSRVLLNNVFCDEVFCVYERKELRVRESVVRKTTLLKCDLVFVRESVVLNSKDKPKCDLQFTILQ